MLKHLLNPDVTAILIKGLPGAGKTTLALELLHTQGRGLYVSTRVSREKLEQQYPQVKDLERVGLMEVQGVKGAEGGAKLEDLRFGRAVDVVERVLQATAKLEEPLVILDSWDAFAKELDVKERLRIEKSLVGMAEASGAKLVFISEEPYLTTTDYLVDAVVTLKDEEVEGRRIRRIEWNKLRGAEIPQKNYLFTLHGGRFRMFQRTEAGRLSGVGARPFEPTAHSKVHYSTGSEDLDWMLEGGLKRGSTILLEIGKAVPADWQLPLLASIELNFMANGGCVVNTSYAGLSPRAFKDAIADYASKDVVESMFRVGHYEEFHPDPCFFMLDRLSMNRSLEMIWDEAMKTRRVSGRHCLIFIDMDVGELIHSEDNMIGYVLRLSLKVKQFDDVLVLKLEEDNGDKRGLSTFCDRHIKLDVIDGTLITYGVRPPSSIYHVGYGYTKGYPKVELVPIV